MATAAPTAPAGAVGGSRRRPTCQMEGEARGHQPVGVAKLLLLLLLLAAAAAAATAGRTDVCLLLPTVWGTQGCCCCCSWGCCRDSCLRLKMGGRCCWLHLQLLESPATADAVQREWMSLYEAAL